MISRGCILSVVLGGCKRNLILFDLQASITSSLKCAAKLTPSLLKVIYSHFFFNFRGVSFEKPISLKMISVNHPELV